MANNRTSIEIEAKGQFSQLTRGLREVKGSLSEVTKVVNAGARSGGFFTDNQVKSLDIFNRRFTDAMNRMNRMVDDQAEKIAELYKRRRAASQADISSIDKEIKKHGEYLDSLEREREELERIFALRRQEADSYGRKPTKEAGGQGGGGGRGGQVEGTNPVLASAGAGLMGAARSMKGIGKVIAGLAGISLTISQVMKWEQMAEQSESAWQPLLQRTGMDRARMTGVGLSRGFNSFETQQMLDVYTQTAGGIGAADTDRMMAFARGYGIDGSTTAGLTGQMSVRGYGGAGRVLDAISGIAESSGMQPRILEVLETSQAFLQSMDKNLKDNTGNSLLAYTARMNQIGNENGALKLTGQNGASILEQMGENIFSPGNTRWQAMGIQLLQRFGGGATSNMNTFDLMSKWQEGFQDPTNMQVLGKYLAEATEGMSNKQAQEYRTLVMQEAMGGSTTLQQARQFGELTNWLQAFDPSNAEMQKLLKGSGVAGQSGIDQQAASWQSTLDARIQISNATWMQKQIEAGALAIPTKLELQDFSGDLTAQVTEALEAVDFGNIMGESIGDVLANVDWWEAIGVVAGAAVGGKILKKVTGGFWDWLTGGKGDGGKPPTSGGKPPTSGGTRPGSSGRVRNVLGPDGKPILPDDAVKGGRGLMGNLFGSRAATVAGGAMMGVDLLAVPGMVAYDQITKQNQANRYLDFYHQMQNTPDGEPVLKGDYSWEAAPERSWWEKNIKDPFLTMQNEIKYYIDNFGEEGKTSLKQVEKESGESKDAVTTNQLKMSTSVDAAMRQFTSSFSNLSLSMLTSMGYGEAAPEGDIQKRVYDTLAANGKADWWANTQWLVNKESSWRPTVKNSTAINPITGALDPNGERAAGLFQFLPNTWKGYASSGAPMDPAAATIEQQTEAFIKYMESRYDGNFGNIKNFGTSAYKGYAVGTYASQDHLAFVHGGEEILSRSKTAEVQRKTGMLPSQLINAVLGGSSGGSGSGSVGGGSRRIVVDVNLNGGQSLNGMTLAQIQQIAREVFTDAAYQAMRQNVVF